MKNIVIVGTKADLYFNPNINIPKKKCVPFSDAVNLCQKLGLAGCLTTSSRFKLRKYENREPSRFFDDLNDAFYICACNSVDETTREIMGEIYGNLIHN